MEEKLDQTNSHSAANAQKSLKGTVVKKSLVPPQKKSTVQDSLSRLLKKKQEEDNDKEGKTIKKKRVG